MFELKFFILGVFWILKKMALKNYDRSHQTRINKIFGECHHSLHIVALRGIFLILRLFFDIRSKLLITINNKFSWNLSTPRGSLFSTVLTGIFKTKGAFELDRTIFFNEKRILHLNSRKINTISLF